MKKTTAAFLVFAVLLVVARVLAPYIVRGVINKKINSMPDIRGHVDIVHLHVVRGGITLEGVDLKKLEDSKQFPLLTLDRIDVYFSWKALLNREVVTNMGFVNPVFIIQKLPPEVKPKEQKIPVALPEIHKDPYEIVRELRNTVPFKISAFKIAHGEVIYKDLTLHPQAEITAKNVNVDAENLTNSKKISETLFATVTVNAKLMNDGETHFTMKINPIQIPPEFKITFQLLNLDIATLNPFLMAAKDIQVKTGYLDLASEVATADKKIEGYVKPLIHDLKVSDFDRDKKEGLGHAIKEKLIGAAAVLIKNQPHKQQATEIPFKGQIEDPKVGVWPAIGKTISNVVIQALTPNLDQTVRLADVKTKKRR